MTDTYLPITNTFIYDEIKYLKTYEYLFFCKNIENQEVFPIPKEKLIKLPFYAFLKNKYYYEKKNSKEFFLDITKPRFDFLLWGYFKKQLLPLIKKHEVQLIQTHFGTGGIAFLRLKKELGLPLVTFFYGYDVSRVQVQQPKLYKKLFKEGDLFLTESHFLAEKLKQMGCPEEKLKVLYQGIDLEDFKFNPKSLKKGEKAILLIVGRFEEKKGIKYAIEAFAQSLEKHPNMELKIMGEGVLRKEIETLIQEKKLQEKVILLGLQPYQTLIKEMDNCHIFMLPSVTAKDGDTEGQGTVFIQASAMGKPILSTNHNGIPQVVIDGKNGFLAPERDAKALSKHLNYLIEHPQEWKAMAAFGRKHVEKNFDIHAQTRKLEKIYDEVLTKKT